MEIVDNTETNLIILRRNIYLTIKSSLNYEECAHKLMKMQLKPGQEVEWCGMLWCFVVWCGVVQCNYAMVRVSSHSSRYHPVSTCSGSCAA